MDVFILLVLNEGVWVFAFFGLFALRNVVEDLGLAVVAVLLGLRNENFGLVGAFGQVLGESLVFALVVVSLDVHSLLLLLFVIFAFL